MQTENQVVAEGQQLAAELLALEKKYYSAMKSELESLHLKKDAELSEEELKEYGKKVAVAGKETFKKYEEEAEEKILSFFNFVKEQPRSVVGKVVDTKESGQTTKTESLTNEQALL